MRPVIVKLVGRVPYKTWIRSPDAVAWLIFGIALLAGFAYLVHLGSGMTFFRDEWFYVQYRDGHDLSNILVAHGDANAPGQLVAGQVLVYLFLFKVFGLSDYIVYRLIALSLLMACSGMVYYLARQTIGRWGAFAPAFVILTLGAAYPDILWPLGILGYAGASCFGLLAFILIERDKGVGDLLATFSLLIALSISGVALPFIVGVSVGLIASNKSFWKRCWVPGVPALAYLGWLKYYGTQRVGTGLSVKDLPKFSLDLLTNALAGLTGLGWGLAMATSLIIFIFISFRFAFGRNLPVLAWQSTAALLFLLVLTGAARMNHLDGMSLIRYGWPIIFLVGLIFIAIAPRRRYRRAYTFGFVAFVLAVTPHGVRSLEEGSDALRRVSNVTKAELAAIEIGRDTIPHTFVVQTSGVLPPETPVTAWAYFGAIDRYESSPAFRPRELLIAPEYARLRADAVLGAAQEVVKVPSDQTEETGTMGRSSCRQIVSGETIKLRSLVNAHVTVKATNWGAEIRTRRFAKQFQASDLPKDRRQTRVLSAPRDGVNHPKWQGLVSGPARVCINHVTDRS